MDTADPDRTGGALHIRAATEADKPAWGALRRALWPGDNAIEAEMGEQLAEPNTYAAFVAELPGGRLVGFAEAALRDDAPGCTTWPVGFLEGWYVEPAFRGRGIGRALAGAAEAWARSRGCSEMASDTNDAYPLSPAAHAALGYTVVKRKVFFHKRLNP